MKDRQEIQSLLSQCRRLREVIPQFTAFGKDNHEHTDVQIKILHLCRNKTASEVEELSTYRLEVLGDDWMGDPEQQVYDWLLGKIEDDLATEGDIQAFTEMKRKKEHG